VVTQQGAKKRSRALGLSTRGESLFLSHLVPRSTSVFSAYLSDEIDQVFFTKNGCNGSSGQVSTAVKADMFCSEEDEAITESPKYTIGYTDKDDTTLFFIVPPGMTASQGIAITHLREMGNE
jgi:hypothetical protein